MVSAVSILKILGKIGYRIAATVMLALCIPFILFLFVLMFIERRWKKNEVD